MNDNGRLLLTLTGLTGLSMLAIIIAALVGPRSKDSVSGYERSLAATWLPRIWKPVVIVMVGCATTGVILVALA